jgi:hypothetical protein
VFNTPAFTVVEDGEDSAIHQLGNYTAYDQIDDNVHVVLITWGGLGHTIAPDMLSLSCVRPNNTQRMSRNPSGSDVSPKAVTSLLLLGTVIAIVSHIL